VAPSALAAARTWTRPEETKVLIMGFVQRRVLVENHACTLS